MDKERLFIKHMVCDRCIRVVREELEKMQLRVTEIELGQATVVSQQGTVDIYLIEQLLRQNGFELIKDRKNELVEQIKVLIIKLIHHGDPPKLLVNYSEYLTSQIGKDYQYLSQVFSAQESITIEKYIILQKTERAKELLTYGELSISKIAQHLDYSSLAHFSNQFKQITHYTPSQYKQLGIRERKSLDKLS